MSAAPEAAKYIAFGLAAIVGFVVACVLWPIIAVVALYAVLVAACLMFVWLAGRVIRR